MNENEIKRIRKQEQILIGESLLDWFKRDRDEILFLLALEEVLTLLSKGKYIK